MKKKLSQGNRQLLLKLVGFFLLIFVWCVPNTHGASSATEYCVAKDHVRNNLYQTGYQAYQRGDWVTAHGLLSFFYLLTVNSGDLQKDQNYMSELINAKNYTTMMLRNMVQENARLKQQLRSIQAQQAGGIGSSVHGVTSTDPSPYLRPNPPN